MTVISHRRQQNYEYSHVCLIIMFLILITILYSHDLMRKGDIYITIIVWWWKKKKPGKVLCKHRGGPPDWTGEEGVWSGRLRRGNVLWWVLKNEMEVTEASWLANGKDWLCDCSSLCRMLSVNPCLQHELFSPVPLIHKDSTLGKVVVHEECFAKRCQLPASHSQWDAIHDTSEEVCHHNMTIPGPRQPFHSKEGL